MSFLKMTNLAQKFHMRVVVQRVSTASVTINGRLKSKIGAGMLVLLGIEDEDDEQDVEWLCLKLSKMRIFSDENGAMNLDIAQIQGSFLVVSQFTLHAMTKKGNRPSFIRSARPEKAIPLYEIFLQKLQLLSNRDVQSGEFGAMMDVALVNDGPVTIIMDSKNRQ
jgi:D-tyrosyl-tRNA(Tyr) deacylase